MKASSAGIHSGESSSTATNASAIRTSVTSGGTATSHSAIAATSSTTGRTGERRRRGGGGAAGRSEISHSSSPDADGAVGGVGARGELVVGEPPVGVVRLEERDRRFAVVIGGSLVTLQDRHATTNGSASRQ